MREKDFENEIKKWLKEHGCWFFKTISTGFQRAGIPDIIACVNGRFVGIEVKSEKGRPSELQKLELKKIQEANGIGLLVYPADFAEFKKKMKKLLNNN